MRGNWLLLLVLVLCWCSATNADVISNIRFDPAPYCAVRTGQHVNVTFDYDITTPGGVRIFPRPITNGALTPDYGGSPSGVYSGTGSGAGYFSVQSGEGVIDHVRFRLTNPDQTQTILEFYVPVEFHYGADAIYNIKITPLPPSSVEHNRHVSISFDYDVSTAGGIRIFPRPFTNGSLSPSYAASGSPLYTGSGTEGGAYFTIASGSVHVDHIRFLVMDANQTQTLQEFLVPVDYQYAAHSISNIVVTPSSPAGLLYGEHVNVTFAYTTTEATGVRIFARPYTDNSASAHYAAHGSGVYPTGSGIGSGWFTIDTVRVNVDSIRFRMTDSAQTTVLLDYFVPVNFYYANQKMSNVTFRPTSPAYFTTGSYDTTSFSYTHANAGGALMWVVPKTGGAWTPHRSYEGSVVIPAGSGTQKRHFTVIEGDEKVDAANLLMKNSTQSETLVDWDIPVEFFFGSQTLTGIDEAMEKPATFALEQNYPNPFNPATVVRYQLPVPADVKLVVHDLLGREVRVLVNQQMPAGVHEVTLDGSGLCSGVYFCRMQSKGFVQTRKMLLVQ